MMRNLLTNRAVLVALGLLLLALIIWFAGPYFAFADVKPLEGVGRLVAILVLVTAYALLVLFRQARNTQQNQRLADEVSRQAGSQDAEDARAASSGGRATWQAFRRGHCRRSRPGAMAPVFTICPGT